MKIVSYCNPNYCSCSTCYLGEDGLFTFRKEKAYGLPDNIAETVANIFNHTRVDGRTSRPYSTIPVDDVKQPENEKFYHIGQVIVFSNGVYFILAQVDAGYVQPIKLDGNFSNRLSSPVKVCDIYKISSTELDKMIRGYGHYTVCDFEDVISFGRIYIMKKL